MSDRAIEFGEAMIEELSSSSLLEPVPKKPKHEDDTTQSYSEEEGSDEVLIEQPFEDLDGPMCCVCQRFEFYISLI